MMRALYHGLHALMWAFALVFTIMYITALVSRDTLGRSQDEVVQAEFRTVGFSMLTVFRCTFGDCATSRGTPLFAQVMEIPYGHVYCCIALVYLFFVTIGCFNVISAIFLN